MSLIFFDLETSDKEFCGQILNYCFMLTNNQFEILAEKSGEISLSVLQIPSPEALLTNRICLAQHQAQAFPHEPQALYGIASFIADALETCKDQVYLCGYNSTRFDLPFLRTSFIRNGINPYFGGKIKYRDVLQLVRKLYLTDAKFPETFHSSDPHKLSLSLEAVSRELGLLDGQQTHHSRDDVLLTIRLCEELERRFHINIANFHPYEVKAGQVFALALSPNYERKEQEPREHLRPLGLLSESYRAALWIDLDRYKAGEGRASVSWVNKNGGQLITEDEISMEATYHDLLKEAKTEFAKLTPDNFFPKSSCDIEQDIYRLDMQMISTLSQIIWDKDKSVLKSVKDKDLQDLVNRYWLAYGVDPERRAENWQQKLSQYANHRYGGSTFQLSKVVPAELTEETRTGLYHPSLFEIVARAYELLANRTDAADKAILNDLISHIEASPLFAALESRSGAQPSVP